MRRSAFALWLAWALQGGVGCVSEIPLDDAGCPCATGYQCCPLDNRCLPNAVACPVSTLCPVPPSSAVANVLTLGATVIGDPTPNFVDIDSVGTLALFHGPQGGGGYHVWTQLKILGLDPTPPITLTRSLFDPADTVRSQATALRFQVDQPSLYCGDDKLFLLMDPPRVYICPSLKTGDAMFDRDLILRIEMADRAGRVLTGERTIHPVCPDGDTNCKNSPVTGCAAP